MTSFTIICDGTSDYALKRIVEWIIESNELVESYDIKIADFRQQKPASNRVVDKIQLAHTDFTADYYIIHRDAEKETHITRQEEIEKGIEEARLLTNYFILAVPVTMLESWFLTDIEAIKKGAGNPNFKGQLNLPKISKIEQLSNPKKILHDLLKIASGLKGRRAKSFNANKAYHNVASETVDFSEARALPSFDNFLQSFLSVVKSNNI